MEKRRGKLKGKHTVKTMAVKTMACCVVLQNAILMSWSAVRAVPAVGSLAGGENEGAELSPRLACSNNSGNNNGSAVELAEHHSHPI